MDSQKLGLSEVSFFIELWAGFAGLTNQVHDADFLCAAPVEAFPFKESYREDMDLRSARVKDAYLDMAEAGLVGWVSAEALGGDGGHLETVPGQMRWRRIKR